MSLSASSKRLFGILAWVITLHVLLAYGLPEWLFAVLLVSSGLLFWRIGAANALTLSFTLVAITVLYGFALKITGFEDRVYYRPEERYLQFDYTNNHRIFAPNIDVKMTMPHGDLRAMTKEDIAEPHSVHFQTDSKGYRNVRDYHGQRWVMVGDSFVTGHSNSQEDVLVSQLARDYGIDAYALGITGNLADYAAYLRGFEREHGNDFHAAIFLFEGNDFDEARERPENIVARYGRRYYSLFSGFNTYRVTMSLLKRALRGKDISHGSSLDIADLAGHQFAFLHPYEEVARRPALTDVENFEPILARLRTRVWHIYFVPEKYRVYQKHVRPQEKLPNAQWEYLAGLCREYQVSCTNLSAPLIEAADEGLRKGELLWWRDDTHWNARGIAVAARIVAADIKAAERNYPNRSKK